MTDTLQRKTEELRGGTLSKTHLVDRLGSGAGAMLFERLDDHYRDGEQVVVAGVKEARDSFTTVAAGRARIVKAQRSARGRDQAPAEEMVLIGISDLEAVVRANDREFSWADAFAPRHDLPVATVALQLRSGARGRNIRI